MANANVIDPLDDLSREVFPTDIPFWSESAAFWAYPESRDWDLYVHYQRQVNDPGVWKCMLTLLLADGDALVMKSFGRQPHHRGQGSREMFGECLEPGKRWRFQYDAAAQRVKQADMWNGLLVDGIVEPLKIDIEFDAVCPIWQLDPEGLESHGDSVMMHKHYEQPFITKGSITVGGVERTFGGVGYRDHSYGPRNYTRMGSSQMVFGIFPSRRAFWFMAADTPEGELAHCEGAISLDGKIYSAQIIDPPFHLKLVRGQETSQMFTFRTELGDTKVNVRFNGMSMPYTVVPPSEEMIGAAGGFDNVPHAYWESNLVSEWDGEIGLGSGQGVYCGS